MLTHMQGAVGCASEPWLFNVPALDRGNGLILCYVVSKYCCVKLYISAEDIDDIDFAWEHDRTLVRAALEGGG
jgi:hypothetical protein